MTASILLIEDEKHIARVVQLELQHEGYEVTVAEDGLKGLDLAVSGPWDLILLDVMLPGLNGMEVLRRLRQKDCLVPVIMLTARDTTSDIVSGFNLGSNDYITKPFATPESLARVRNLLQLTKRKEEEKELLQAADLKVDLKSRKVTREGACIELTPKEFDLLQYLMVHKGHVVSREQIISDVWGYDFVGDTNIVDVYIRYLRQKIDKGRKPKLIRTSRG
ncbi:response regulator transcription factor [Paenibacillus sp. P26]|nr:response regulator transcription factor [Paenibacillus sp. P26]